MQTREAVAWSLVALVAIVVVAYWTPIKTAWKYRNQISSAADVYEGLKQAGVIR
jgi:hypothetical protein